MTSNQYKAAGVDVEAGDSLVDWLVETQKDTEANRNVISGIGGFASLFRADFSKYKEPCLVTCTDGVGTKVLLAAEFKQYATIGQDLVAMCVNDLVCTGGDPLIFLDYYATGRLDLGAAKEFLNGVKRACNLSNCALVGGETAEMPGVYQPTHFDCAGFSVGVVDRVNSWGPERVRTGDILLGVESSGFHSNGYSLLRKVFSSDLSLWKDELLKPTALYVQLCQDLKSEAVDVHAAAHITGGGIENIPRVLPSDKTWKMIDWEIPKSFLEVQRRLGISKEELLKTLNCGVGFVLILPPSEQAQAEKISNKLGFKTFKIGEVS